MDVDNETVLEQHLQLLVVAEHGNDEQLTTSPLLTEQTLRLAPKHHFSQFGLLGSIVPGAHDLSQAGALRLFYNTTAPSSTFICGSQGSGKSHTLSCLLENCLTESPAALLPKPLTALCFHYDTFISDDGGSPCEAAFLASLAGVKVRVLCSATNVATIKKTYGRLNVQVETLQLSETNLNTKRMLDLMAFVPDSGPVPLYVYTIDRILREMRIEQQASGKRFEYKEFKSRLLSSDLTPTQLAPLDQRLSVLESFMPRQEPILSHKGKITGWKTGKGTDWTVEPGSLTIIDLSCPCIMPSIACALFNVCLSIFLEQDITCGRVVALDEAHKYMTCSVESATLTNTLLSAVRLQRHLGVRVLVSTQEPTIEPALLDLCSITIMHRFTSPAWFKVLKAHLGAQGKSEFEDHDATFDIFRTITELKTGEGLVFAPTALIKDTHRDSINNRELHRDVIKIRLRARLSQDGGKSVMAD